MGGLSKCTIEKLAVIDAKDYKGKLMTEWFPQDYRIGDATQKCIHFTFIF